MTHDKYIIGIFRQNESFLKRFGSLEVKVSVSSL
jgi:hypothetical protein